MNDKIKQIIREKEEAKKREEAQEAKQNQKAVAEQGAVPEPASEIDQLTKENQDLKEKLLRTLAELENTRKRNQEEVEKASTYGISKFVIDLSNIVENLFLALDNIPQEAIKGNKELENFVYGLELNHKELMKALETHGISRIYPLHEAFNHELHQAVSKTPSGEAEDTVIQVIQAGYKLKDRLLKPALVIVSSHQD